MLRERPPINANSEEFLRVVLDSIPAQVAVVDEQGLIISTNKPWVEFRQTLARGGFPAPALVGDNYLQACRELVASGCADAEKLRLGVQQVLSGMMAQFHMQYELKHLTPSETGNRWFTINVAPLHRGAPYFVVTHQDITAQVQAEVALRAERDKLQNIAAVAPGVIHSLALKPDGMMAFVYASPGIEEIYGVSVDELRQSADLAIERIHKDDYQRVQMSAFESVKQLTLWHCEFRVHNPQKGLIWVEGRSKPVVQPDGTIVWHGFLTDITARKQAENALRRSEEHLRLAMGTAPLGTWELDLKDYTLRSSENLWTMMGRDEVGEPASLESYSAAVHPDDRQRFLDELMRAIDTGRALRSEYRVMRNDGTMRWSLSHGRVVSDPNDDQRKRFVVVDLDVTARKQLEDQFHQSQKMEAIGRLAGGVAHDFNNLLTVINGYCYVLLSGLSNDDARRQHVSAIRDAGERAARLTRQLLAFSRKSIATSQLIDLNILLANFEELLGRLVGEDVVLTIDLLPDRLLIQADPAQIEQVIVNLAVNARDAMGSGGRLIIRTNIVSLANPASFAHGILPSGDYAEITVTDTGCGMPSEVQDKVFEPFFTTKPVGKGTGIGLSVVHGIITQSGGAVTVQSQVGVGSTFRILLPLTEAEQAGQMDVSSSQNSAGDETILLVEDEESVRRIACVALESQGYRVLSASSAFEGIELFQQHRDEIRLLLSDLVMPGMGGGQLAKELRRIRPTLKVLFMSGYSEEVCVQQGVRTSMEAFLAKPFKPSTLARKVRSVLDQDVVTLSAS